MRITRPIVPLLLVLTSMLLALNLIVMTSPTAIAAPAPRGDVGACCLPNGTCLDLTSADCVTQNGSHLGAGTNCAGVTCEPFGACCLPAGTCSPASESFCGFLSGIYLGDGTVCDASSCPQGACCLPTGLCEVRIEASCLIDGGQWKGAGTDCADFNGNGIADICEQSSCPADTNGDTMIDVVDLLKVLADWGPCP